MSMVRPLAVACLAAFSLLPAVPAAAAGAPGRVAFSVATKVPLSNVDAGGAGAAVALPDGGAVMLAFTGSAGLTAVALRADGSPDPSFGSRGIARIAVPVSFSGTQQLLRRPDGRLLAVGTRAPASRFGLPRFTIVGLTAHGALDPSFGIGGVAELELQASCGGDCGAAALAPDGSIVITGSVGEASAPGSGSMRWIVIRLTPAGALDPGFGLPVIDGPAGLNTGGSATVVRPSGQVVVLGTHAGVTQLAGLTASGAPDPSFHGGAPLTVADRGYRAVLHGDGSIDVAGDGHLQRFTPAGGRTRRSGRRARSRSAASARPTARRRCSPRPTAGRCCTGRPCSSRPSPGCRGCMSCGSRRRAAWAPRSAWSPRSAVAGPARARARPRASGRTASEGRSSRAPTAPTSPSAGSASCTTPARAPASAPATSPSRATRRC